MQHRGLVCATLLFLAVMWVLPAAPAAADPGLVRVPDVLASLWNLWDLLGDPATGTGDALRSTGAELHAGFDGDGFTLPPDDGGDGSLTTEVLDPDDPPTEGGRGFDGDG